MSRVCRNGQSFLAAPKLALALILCLSPGDLAKAATSAEAEADGAAIEACLNEPQMIGHDPRECGERLLKSCLAAAGDAAQTPSGAIACEKRRGEAWITVLRQAYRRIDAKLADTDKRLLRTSQVQFELELKDLCTATRELAGGDAELAMAACVSDVIAGRALSLVRLAGGRGATP
jgi:hypothetical protein